MTRRDPPRPQTPAVPTEPLAEDSLELLVMELDGTASRVICPAIDADGSLPTSTPRTNWRGPDVPSPPTPVPR